MARSLLMDCLIRLLSPVLCLDFSSQDRYHSVCYCASIRWFVIKFLKSLKALKFFRILFYYFFFFWLRNLKTLSVKYWNRNRGSQQRESTVCYGLKSRFFTSICEFLLACAVLKRSINPKINRKRDPGVICIPRSLECDFPRNLARKGRLKDLQCYCICISKHQERHAVVKNKISNKRKLDL